MFVCVKVYHNADGDVDFDGQNGCGTHSATMQFDRYGRGEGHGGGMCKHVLNLDPSLTVRLCRSTVDDVLPWRDQTD